MKTFSNSICELETHFEKAQAVITWAFFLAIVQLIKGWRNNNVSKFNGYNY